MPAFVLPVFTAAPRDNRLYAQIIGSGDRIAGFEPLEIGDHEVCLQDGGDLIRVGDAALWGFQFDDGPCRIAERPALQPSLAAIAPDLPPMLRLQMARLFDDVDLPRHVAAAYRALHEMGPKSADLWRDLIVLLPEVRRTLLSGRRETSAIFRAAVTQIELRTAGTELRVTVPRFLVDGFGGDDALRAALAPLRDLLDALGIARIAIVAGQDQLDDEPTLAIRRGPELTIIHCLAERHLVGRSTPRNIAQVFQEELFDARGKVLHARLPLLSEAVLLLVDDHPISINAATALAASLASKRPYVGTLVVPNGAPTEQLAAYRDKSDRDNRFDAISRTSRWLAFAGLGTGGQPGLGTTPIANASPSHLARWIPEAITACLQAGEQGKQALKLLHRRAKGPKFGSVASATASGQDAVEQATLAALRATTSSACPAETARELVLVAFHNRPLDARARQQIEACARKWNDGAAVTVVEELRTGMKRQARVVVFARRRLPEIRPWVPPPHLDSLVAAGWSANGGTLGALGAPELDRIVRKGALHLALRVESDLVLDDISAQEIMRSTPMYHGEVVLLVKEIRDPAAQERLLSGGIFCAPMADAGMLDRYGPALGTAILSVLAKLDRATVCERVRRYVADHVLEGLWNLTSMENGGNDEIYGHWKDGTYDPSVLFEEFRFRRAAADGTYFFHGIACLASNSDAVPRLRYKFGVALDASGLRPTRLEPVAGEHDVEAELHAQIRALYENDSRQTLQKDASLPATAESAQQLMLPILGED